MIHEWPMSLRTHHYAPLKHFVPPSLVPVQVCCDECKGFRCLAYQDQNNVWRDFKTGAVLTGEVRPVEYVFGAPDKGNQANPK